MTTRRAPSPRISLAKAAPRSLTRGSSISSPTSPRTSYALTTRWTIAAGRDRRGPPDAIVLVPLGRQPIGPGDRRGVLVTRIGQHAQVPAAASGTVLGGREHPGARGGV